MPSFLANLANRLATWLAQQPLARQAKIGAWLGRKLLWSSGMTNRLNDNLRTARLADRVSLRSVAESVGQLAIETAALWKTPNEVLLSRVRGVHGWDEVVTLRDTGRGIIFLTPHLATFEMASIYIGAQMPMTAMFRPPREAWAEPMMRAGRDRLQIKSVPADMSGIRAMLKALRRGEPIGLLPDQVPTSGDGVWAPFFGRPAYTMTLVQKFARTTESAVVMVACKRLTDGRGYELRFDVLPPFSGAPEVAAAELNAAIERAIEFAPSQYLWTYNRYKVPPEQANRTPATIVMER
ncbi:MAG: lysophospholipid acyltransferase family protein [Casimicrobium sp.]